jgi:hypothetical protein
LREVHRLQVFKHRVLRKIFGLKMGKLTGERRKLHNRGVCDVYSSPNII